MQNPPRDRSLQPLINRLQCIVLATRPLVMWLFMLSMQSFSSEPQQLAAPIEALLRAGADSATSVLTMLAALAERNLLGT